MRVRAEPRDAKDRPKNNFRIFIPPHPASPTTGEGTKEKLFFRSILIRRGRAGSLRQMGLCVATKRRTPHSTAMSQSRHHSASPMGKKSSPPNFPRNVRFSPFFQGFAALPPLGPGQAAQIRMASSATASIACIGYTLSQLPRKATGDCDSCQHDKMSAAGETPPRNCRVAIRSRSSDSLPATDVS